MIGTQTKSLTYFPTNKRIKQKYWQSLSYLPSTVQAGSHKIKLRIITWHDTLRNDKASWGKSTMARLKGALIVTLFGNFIKS